MSGDYYWNTQHVSIWGLTGNKEAGYGGKSVIANSWFFNAVDRGSFDYGIFFNPKADDFVRGVKCEDYKDVADAMQMGNNLVNVVPDSTTGEKEHDELMRFLNELKGSKIVVHDEATDYDEEGGSLHWAVKRGGNEADMKNIVLSQSPVDVEPHITKQTTVRVWVGPVPDDDVHYFRQIGAADLHEFIQENIGPFEWVVFDQNGQVLDWNEPVPEAFT